MFVHCKGDTGAVPPWEHLRAAAGTYQAGQLLTVSGGKLAAISGALDTTPPYLCMAERTVEDGELLPVTRVSRDYIYETTLAAAAAGAAVGGMLQIASGGLKAETGSGTFEIVSLSGTAAGDTVRGRFV